MNGYKNYKTWNISLWVNNDEELYNIAKNCNDYNDFKDEMVSLGIDSTPDEVSYNDNTLDINQLNDVIREII